jgi:hypothetical protein
LALLPSFSAAFLAANSSGDSPSLVDVPFEVFLNSSGNFSL